jgi:hypothetical protein
MRPMELLPSQAPAQLALDTVRVGLPPVSAAAAAAAVGHRTVVGASQAVDG